jgi:hypothetical protein
MKNHPVRAELFHADGQTDIMKLIVVFRNLANLNLYLYTQCPKFPYCCLCDIPKTFLKSCSFFGPKVSGGF